MPRKRVLRQCSEFCVQDVWILCTGSPVTSCPIKIDLWTNVENKAQITNMIVLRIYIQGGWEGGGGGGGGPLTNKKRREREKKKKRRERRRRRKQQQKTNNNTEREGKIVTSASLKLFYEVIKLCMIITSIQLCLFSFLISFDNLAKGVLGKRKYMSTFLKFISLYLIGWRYKFVRFLLRTQARSWMHKLLFTTMAWSRHGADSLWSYLAGFRSFGSGLA